MPNFYKLTFALVLTLTTGYSSNLDQVKAQQDGYYYVPPHELKSFEQLTKTEQTQAKKFQYDREKFTQWFIQNNNTAKWADFEANTTK